MAKSARRTRPSASGWQNRQEERVRQQADGKIGKKNASVSERMAKSARRTRPSASGWQSPKEKRDFLRPNAIGCKETARVFEQTPGAAGALRGLQRRCVPRRLSEYPVSQLRSDESEVISLLSKALLS